MGDSTVGQQIDDFTADFNRRIGNGSRPCSG
jgi:hypothetical protein